jgi:hypothetical protein
MPDGQNVAHDPMSIGMYKTIMAGSPRLVVAVTGYANPYPAATDVITNMLILCPKLIDTVATCITRWGQLPMALTAIDLAIQKLNTTIKNAVAPFATGSAGRFVYVDTYTKTRSHCMKMDVSIKTSVNHSTFQDEHDADQDFGCSSPWYVAQSDVSTIPTYLEPAADGVLITETQQVSGMGIHLNDAGQKCVSDLIWNAPTIDGTPLKWKLGVPEAVNTNVCGS